MMLSVFCSFINTYFFQPWLNTDICITTPMSFASHEINNSSLLDKELAESSLDKKLAKWPSAESSGEWS